MNATATTCTITVHEIGPYRTTLPVEIASDFSEPFIDALKRDLAWQDRAWNESARRWYVAGHCLPRAEALAVEHYDRATLVTDGGRTLTNLKTGETHTQERFF